MFIVEGIDLGHESQGLGFILGEFGGISLNENTVNAERSTGDSKSKALAPKP